MRVLIPAAALLLGALAWSARARQVEAPRHSAPAAVVPARVEEAATTSAVGTETLELDRGSTAPATVKPVIAEPETPAPLFIAPGWALELGRELGLDERQKAWVAEILRDRAQVIGAYEREVRVRGWFRIDDFARRAGDIREGSYDRIEAALNPDQSRAFAALRPGLIHKDFFSIAIPETDVVCLD